MKLWILRPVKHLPDDKGPWNPWYDKSFGFVVIADTEKLARKVAHDNAGDENDDYSPWIDSKYSTCDELTPEYGKELVMKDFAAA